MEISVGSGEVIGIKAKSDGSVEMFNYPEIEKVVEKVVEKPKRYFNPLNKSKFRNKPCMCGSGKKTKACHGKTSQMNQAQYDEMNEIHKKQFGVPMGKI